MTLQQLRAQAEAALTAAIAERRRHQDALVALRGAVDTDETITAERVDAAIAERDAATARVDAAEQKRAEIDAEIAEEARIAVLERQSVRSAPRPAYDEVARVGAEERTYRADRDPAGEGFVRDVSSLILNPSDFEARDRLSRHQSEERVERGEYLKRAAGTGAFSGLVVPQYLTDLYAPAAQALRPFADACNKHPLPAAGMTVNISRITTSTSSAIQSSENTAVSSTDIDDTLLSPAVQTIAGQQVLSRQAIERGTGVESVMLDDLFRGYATRLDSTLINQATTGLSAAATAITYTDASPTVAEVLPLIFQGLSAVEAAMLDQASGDNIAVMHSRRWYWLQNAINTATPLITQPGVSPLSVGANLASKYGAGARGTLPNGTPVIVDNNVPTNLGGGTNQDELYLLDRRECHLWEDASAPMFIRAEQTAAASLGVLFVVYGYIAYTFSRYSHAQKLSGTGLITPTFTGA